MSASDARSRGASTEEPRKKKKKRRAPPADPGAAVPPPVDHGKPAFAAKFPEHDGLARLVQLFEDGDYAAVHAGAEKLRRDDAPRDVVRAAEDLVRRTRPDPGSGLLLLLAAILLGALAVWYVTHKHVG
jgi:hypothetical protein